MVRLYFGGPDNHAFSVDPAINNALPPLMLRGPRQGPANRHGSHRRPRAPISLEAVAKGKDVLWAYVVGSTPVRFHGRGPVVAGE